MFERRLKIFLGLVFGVTLLLLLRALYLQVVQHENWRKEAARSLSQPRLVETVRGRILDYRNREIARDEPCLDACVDYRAIQRDEKWMKDQARQRLLRNNAQAYRRADQAQRAAMLQAELARLNTDLDVMWATLAKLSGQTQEQIEQVCAGIRQRVEMRCRYIWYWRYRRALQEYQESREPMPWYKQWMLGEGDAPEIDTFSDTVSEQTDAHAILHDIDSETQNILKKKQDQFPGLALRPGTHRVYPFGQVAGHVVGHLSPVTREDLDKDPYPEDQLRKYWPNDLIGRGGIEGLCEPALRGVRGRLDRDRDRGDVISSVASISGQDVKITLDMELQAQIQQLLDRVELQDREGRITVRQHLHGAAVVIDVPSGEVRALVSNPGFDPNQLAGNYEKWAGDDINNPLLNRATMAQFPPGSTLKTVVGLGGLTHHFLAPSDTIECTGYLVIDGHAFRNSFRCWTMTEWGKGHHDIPYQDPHPTGFLTATDALQRSCNVYFETLANRMGLKELDYWFDRFGLGRKTGIGIAESSGHLPNPDRLPKAILKSTTWLSGIGQGQVTATPLQMANIAATIARNGIWVRPHLVDSQAASTRPAGPDRVDLQLSPEALAAVRLGMFRVVNGGAAGTGTQTRRDDMNVCGKTGSAQSSKFTAILRDEGGQPVKVDGKIQRQVFEPGAFPWYQGTGGQGRPPAHAWYIGFAPAERPQIAFCVMVEYGGTGGGMAGTVAKGLLEACVQHGYLAPTK